MSEPAPEPPPESEAVLWEARYRRAVDQINQVNIALGSVTTLDGMVGAYPPAVLVASIVSDHEELEARIDAVVSYLVGPARGAASVEDVIVEVGRLVRGGTRIPDTPEELDD